MPAIVTTLILTAITSVFWIIFNVYRSFSEKPKNEVPAEVLEPLNPNLDTQTIENIKARFYLESIPEPVITTPSETESTPVPQASEEANLSQNP